MAPLTIQDLYEECKKQIKEGNGDKVIMLSDDDEGNGFHYCWYSFSPTSEYITTNEEITKAEDTIILG